MEIASAQDSFTLSLKELGYYAAAASTSTLNMTAPTSSTSA
jgi:hypothetical protein